MIKDDICIRHIHLTSFLRLLRAFQDCPNLLDDPCILRKCSKVCADLSQPYRGKPAQRIKAYELPDRQLSCRNHPASQHERNHNRKAPHDLHSSKLDHRSIPKEDVRLALLSKKLLRFLVLFLLHTEGLDKP